MTDEAFLRAILVDPTDPAPRLVYADWLEERGDPDSLHRAEYLRVECRLNNLPSADRSRRKLQAQLRQLRKLVGDRWQRSLMPTDRESMASSIDHDRFLVLLTERFPEIATTIDDCFKGLLHLEMAALARATQTAIDNQDRDTVRRHFRFIDEVLPQATSDVENAIHVSYLENLRFEGRKAGPTKARQLLTPRLQQALGNLEDYLNRLFGKEDSAS